jgi:uncharacterized membrane protein
VSRSRKLLGAFWVFAGTMHFVRRREYEAIVPDYVPISAADAVTWSGYAEIAGGVAVLPAPTRRLGRWWLLGVLVAVFPANVHMAVDPAAVAAKGVPADRIPRALLWARLPVQWLFIRWAWRATA